jgi:hypothetical protein
VPDFEHENLGDCDQDYAYRNETLQSAAESFDCQFQGASRQIEILACDKLCSGDFSNRGRYGFSLFPAELVLLERVRDFECINRLVFLFPKVSSTRLTMPHVMY